MAFVGQVQRMAWGAGQQGTPAALFVFDDTLIFARLGYGLTMGIGFRPSKKDQDSIKAVSELGTLTPQLVRDRWPKTLDLVIADIIKARLGRSLHGALSGVLELEIDVQGGRTYGFLAHRSVKEPLVRMLQSVLGDRFPDSSDVSQSSLDTLTESRKHDTP